jgi:hypothetical protein
MNSVDEMIDIPLPLNAGNLENIMIRKDLLFFGTGFQPGNVEEFHI